MICPACNNKMIVVEHRRIELDYCPQCRGVWFDSGELELMLKSSGIDTKAVDTYHLPEARTGERQRRCPICHQLMSKKHIGQKPPVLIDVCRRSDGIFFDGGEVNQLVTQLPGKAGGGHPAADFLSDVFKPVDKNTLKS